MLKNYKVSKFKTLLLLKYPFRIPETPALVPLFSPQLFIYTMMFLWIEWNDFIYSV